MEKSTTLDEDLFQLAKDDAFATYAPKQAIFGSGFLAGFLITWLPLIVYVVLFIWDALFGTVVPGSADGRFQMALRNLGQSWAMYVAGAWLYSIVLGGLGVLFAYLRALSCLMNLYFRIATRDGEIRLGMHQVIGLIGVPLVAGIVIQLTMDNPQAFYILVVPIILSGLVFNILFQSLQNAFLRKMFQPDDVTLTIQGLKVFIPRQVGMQHAHIDDIKLDKQRGITEVIGTFTNDATREEVRHIVSHFLRGYDPVHVRNAEKKAS